MTDLRRPITLLVAAAALGCTGHKEDASSTVTYQAVGEYVTPTDSFPRLRYFEGQLISLNDRCAVRKTRLNQKMPPVYVNGWPIGFC